MGNSLFMLPKHPISANYCYRPLLPFVDSSIYRDRQGREYRTRASSMRGGGGGVCGHQAFFVWDVVISERVLRNPFKSSLPLPVVEGATKTTPRFASESFGLESHVPLVRGFPQHRGAVLANIPVDLDLRSSPRRHQPTFHHTIFSRANQATTN